MTGRRGLRTGEDDAEQKHQDVHWTRGEDQKVLGRYESIHALSIAQDWSRHSGVITECFARSYERIWREWYATLTYKWSQSSTNRRRYWHAYWTIEAWTISDILERCLCTASNRYENITHQGVLLRIFNTQCNYRATSHGQVKTWWWILPSTIQPVSKCHVFSFTCNKTRPPHRSIWRDIGYVERCISDVSQ